MLLDNIFIRTLSRIFDFILLNILWLICSLPIITIGASTTALYSVMLKIVVNEEGYIIRSFFDAFRKNFKQSTVIWMILAVIGVVLGVDFMIVRTAPKSVEKIGTVLMGGAILIYVIEIIFVFPLIAQFKNTTMNMIKNAILIPVSRLPFMLLVLFLTVMCVILTLLNQTTIMVGAVIWSLIGVSVLSFANSVLIRVMLKPFVKNEDGE
ncbi:YesL family protein [Bariatricus sp. SGI.154]|uniref:YesL family protein n=1 Tax=Bariatricus sp. SGI.154 TaxID=3420549 RepID=UPI003D05854B